MHGQMSPKPMESTKHFRCSTDGVTKRLGTGKPPGLLLEQCCKSQPLAMPETQPKGGKSALSAQGNPTKQEKDPAPTPNG